MAGGVKVYWHLMAHDKLRMAMSSLGIAFAVFVMFMEVGFFNGLNDSQSILPPRFKAELVMMSKKKVHLNKVYKFYLANLHQMLAYPEVAAVVPLYDGHALLKNPATGLYNAITVLAFPAGSDPLDIKGLTDHLGDLLNYKALIYDPKSRSIYGDIKLGSLLDLDGVKYNVAAFAELGPSFSRNGYVFMNSAAWLTHPAAGYPFRPDLGLIQLHPGADPLALAERARPHLSDDVVLLTPEQVRQREMDFTTYQTPVGIIFGIGLVVGFIIGVIICYQILFNEITDHLPQYATLRAVGYTKRYLVILVLKAALVLSCMGFVPGLLLTLLFYRVIEDHSGIIMALTAGRVAFVMALTVLMCLLAGTLAGKRVLLADPAELF